MIGTPPIEEWPESCSLPWNTFANRAPTSWYAVVPTAEFCPLAKQLLELMLAFDPSRRVTASEALQHPYFRDDGYAPVAFSPSSGSSSVSSSSAGDSLRSETPLPMSCSSNDDSGHSSADGQPEPDN